MSLVPLSRANVEHKCQPSEEDAEEEEELTDSKALDRFSQVPLWNSHSTFSEMYYTI